MKYLILIFLCLPGIVFAHDNDDGPIINNTYIAMNQTGVASAIAQSQIARDWNTTRQQIGVGIGRFEGNDAIAVGAAIKPCNDCLLFTGSIARENGVTSAGFGINWRF